MDSIQVASLQAQSEFENCNTLSDLQQARAKFLGKNGTLTTLLKSLGTMSPEARAVRGQELNQLKQFINAAADAKETILKAAELQAQLAAEAIDITLPGRGQARGSLHPVTMTQQRIEDFFHSLGFTVAEGPEIEDQFHNFETCISQFLPFEDGEDRLHLDK